MYDNEDQELDETARLILMELGYSWNGPYVELLVFKELIRKEYPFSSGLMCSRLWRKYVGVRNRDITLPPTHDYVTGLPIN
jgi:hypothetical protein